MSDDASPYDLSDPRHPARIRSDRVDWRKAAATERTRYDAECRRLRTAILDAIGELSPWEDKWSEIPAPSLERALKRLDAAIGGRS